MSLGERLKKSRENAGWTVKKFADATKIPQKYIERLEGGRYEKLPPFVYVSGFLKKYSEILGLPVDELLSEYQKEAKISEQISPLQKLPLLGSPRFVVTPKRITLAVIILIILFVAGYLFYQINLLIAPPKLAIKYPTEDILINRSTIEISGATDYTAKLTINGQQVLVERDGSFHQEINLSPGVNTLKIVAENRFGKKNEIIRQIVVR